MEFFLKEMKHSRIVLFHLSVLTLGSFKTSIFRGMECVSEFNLCRLVFSKTRDVRYYLSNCMHFTELCVNFSN